MPAQSNSFAGCFWSFLCPAAPYHPRAGIIHPSIHPWNGSTHQAPQRDSALPPPHAHRLSSLSWAQQAGPQHTAYTAAPMAYKRSAQFWEMPRGKKNKFVFLNRKQRGMLCQSAVCTSHSASHFSSRLLNTARFLLCQERILLRSCFFSDSRWQIFLES